MKLYGIIPPRRIEVEWLIIDLEETPEWDEFMEAMKLLLLSNED
jgi:hypothetical protein